MILQISHTYTYINTHPTVHYPNALNWLESLAFLHGCDFYSPPDDAIFGSFGSSTLFQSGVIHAQPNVTTHKITQVLIAG